jgi:hypothetical protein
VTCSSSSYSFPSEPLVSSPLFTSPPHRSLPPTEGWIGSPVHPLSCLSSAELSFAYTRSRNIFCIRSTATSPSTVRHYLQFCSNIACGRHPNSPSSRSSASYLGDIFPAQHCEAFHSFFSHSFPQNPSLEYFRDPCSTPHSQHSHPPNCCNARSGFVQRAGL